MRTCISLFVRIRGEFRDLHYNPPQCHRLPGTQSQDIYYGGEEGIKFSLIALWTFLFAHCAWILVLLYVKVQQCMTVC